MFVILRGEIGVFDLDGRPSDSLAVPAFTHQEGEIVGELAFALSRTRTAKLVTLTDVALLSFNFSEVSARLSAMPSSELALAQVSRFITYRVLEHASGKAAYLLGTERTGPLAAGQLDWKPTLNLLHSYCQLIHIDVSLLQLDPDSGPILTIADIRLHGSGNGSDGLYILVAGSLVDRARSTALSGEDFPALWVDVPGLPVLPHRSFIVDADPIKVLRIGAMGINRLESRKRLSLSKALRRALVGEPSATVASLAYRFDVFLSYAHKDIEIVKEVAARFKAAGISYWLDAEHIGFGDFVTQKIEHGLRSCRYLVLCVSPSIAGSQWIADEWGPVLHAELSRRPGRTVIPLMLGENDDGLPLMLADKHRVHYADEAEFATFLNFVSRAPGEYA
jgi:hypothetical protein